MKCIGRQNSADLQINDVVRAKREFDHDTTIKSGEANDSGQASVWAPLAKLQSTKTKGKPTVFALEIHGDYWA